MTVLNLFRGQVIGPSMDVIGDDALLTLDLEDYNRLPPMLNIGAPTGSFFQTQADGTALAVDPRGQVVPLADSFGPFSGGGCWPENSPDLDVVTGFLSPEPDMPDGIDWGTSLSDLKAFTDAKVPYISGATRWWIAPPPSGDGLVLYVVDYLDPDQTDQLPAPYEINSDSPNWTTSILPIHLGPIKWDWVRFHGSIYVRGGTPAPEGSGYFFGTGLSRWGDAYVDAPGSITNDDCNAIGLWHQNHDLLELMTGSAQLPAAIGTTTLGGWRVGQTVLITSARHSRLDNHVLDARAAVIQKVTGRLVTPQGALSILVGGTPLTTPFEWRTLEFEQVMGGAGKATVVLHLLSDDDILTIDRLSDVWITLDDSLPADIEWDIEFGDIPAGSLSRELAKAEVKPPPPVAYHFNVTFDRNLPIGKTGPVKAQLADAAENGIPLAGVPMEWVILANDIDDNPLDTTGWLADDVGTTDTAGAVFTEWTPGEGASAVEISAVALPIA